MIQMNIAETDFYYLVRRGGRGNIGNKKPGFSPNIVWLKPIDQ